MPYLIKNITNLVTCRGGNKPRKGKELSDIGLIRNGFVVIEGSRISFAGGSREFSGYKSKNGKKNYREIDGRGKTVMPGFVDSHTHLVFAGSRSDEYEMRIKGSSYEEIAEAGGGISSTVSSVRKSSRRELTAGAEKRLKNFIRYGTTMLEAKSGYGLNTETEIRMLEAINELNRKNKYGLDILPTFLGAHSIPKELSKKEYIKQIMFEMIPEIARRKLARFADVFCEKGYFDADETEMILSEAAKFGMIPKVHTDQFNSIGGIDTAIKVRAISVDHLEVLKDRDIRKLSGTDIIATMLPGASYFLDIPYPPARKIIENNIPAAIATDFNPGSCNTENIQFIMSLSSLKMKMSAEEIINAVTINAAFALFEHDRAGSIERGKQADVLMFDFPSYKDLIYHFGINEPELILKKGKILKLN